MSQALNDWSDAQARHRAAAVEATKRETRTLAELRAAEGLVGDALYSQIEPHAEGTPVPPRRTVIVEGVIAHPRSGAHDAWSRLRSLFERAARGDLGATAKADVAAMTETPAELFKREALAFYEKQQANFAREREAADEERARDAKLMHAERLASDPLYVCQCEIRTLKARVATLEAELAAMVKG